MSHLLRVIKSRLINFRVINSRVLNQEFLFINKAS